MRHLDELRRMAAHYEDVSSAIREYFGQILDGDFHNRPDLLGARLEDVKALLRLRLLENDRAVSLTILAAVESWFRTDGESRAANREKSPVGRGFRTMYAAGRKSKPRIRFDDILEVWSQARPEAKRTVGNVRNAFKYRHWLAHGRYWTPKFGQKYDYYSIYVIADDVVALLNSI